MAQIKISALTTGTPKGTDLTPATDTTDTTQAASGTTKKYIRSAEFNFYLHALGLTTYTATRVATTVALTVTYANGAAGVGATLTNAGAQAALSIDGVALAVNDRVLVKNQASQLQNGIYTVTNIGSGATNWVMTRATDYDQAAEVVQFGVILSDQGTLNAGILWQETAAGPFTIGTSPITFAAFSIQSLSFPVTVPQGGTGLTSLTAYAPLCGGTTSTGNVQQVTLGAAGTILQSAGAAALPTFTTATYPAIATGTGTILRANGTNWVASTSTFADTYAASSLLYSNGANTVTGLATANSASLVTNSTGVPAWSSSMTNGQVIIGSTGATPTAATLTAGSGISISNGAGSITISAATSGIVWTTIAGTTQAAAVNNGYIVGNAAQTTITLPATFAIGDVVIIKGLGAAGWILAANAGDTIQLGQTATSAGGSLTSAANFDTVYVTGIVANTTWSVDYAFSTGLTPA